MDPQRWARIESLYHAALAKAPGDREDYLAVECAQEPEVRHEVESLLKGADEPLNRVGPYEILGLLGAGGMGEVYRARDTRLKREVALKVLPDAFASDRDRMARFQREAEVLASINHPNIAHVYGLEERAIVMELVEGETLAAPLPIDTVLNYARQIAEALEYAHEKGIIHRDLKPANVKVTRDGQVKLLDFGLAKAVEDPSASSGDPSKSPTITIGATRAGMILGTAAYMSPEQAAGRPVDRRSDIWSFGAVLYEMLAGKRAFDGESISETLADVLRSEPDWNALPAATPTAIRNLVRRCLTKDRKQRLQAIGEARIALENPDAGETAQPPTPSKSRSIVLAWSVAILSLAAAAVLAIVHFRQRPAAAEVMRFEIPAPGKRDALMYPVVSPNGRLIAFCPPAPSGARSTIWVRSLDSTDARQVPGTDSFGGAPFWSPDSRFLAFLQGDKLKKVDVSGGGPQTLCAVPGHWRGGAWSRNNVIVFGAVGQGILRVSDSGGPASPVTALDPSREEGFHGAPSFLPDSRHFVYYRDARAPENRGAFVGSLDAKPGEQRSIHLPIAGIPLYVPSPDPDSGYLLFQQEGALMGQFFDNRRLQLSGNALVIANDLPNAYGPLQFSASGAGVLAYFRSGLSDITQLVWFDRSGRKIQDVGEPGRYNSVALSPDGSRAAVSQTQTPADSDFDIWVDDFAHGTRERITSDTSKHYMPVWSPDGSRIAFVIRGGGAMDLFQKDSSGVGNEELLLKSKEPQYLYDWNGRLLLYGRAIGQHIEVWYLPTAGEDRTAKPYLQDISQSQAQFSPDGRFVAYTADDTGKDEVYVRPFPDASSGKWLISSNGGSQPRWRRDGKELFYISSGSKMMATAVTTVPQFKNGLPHELFTVSLLSAGNAINGFRYDVSHDGEKFLINTVAAEAANTRPPITVIVNWPTLLLKK